MEKTTVNIGELNALVNRSIKTLDSLLNTVRDDEAKLNVVECIINLKQIIDNNGIELLKNKSKSTHYKANY